MASLKANSDLFVWSKACSDSFPAFARKLALVLRPMAKENVQSHVEHAQRLGLRYKGASVHRSMLLGAMKYVEVSDSTHRLFMKLERRFGKDVWTENGTT